MVTQRKGKRKTNWREQLKKHGEKVLRDPLKYSFYSRGEYTPAYERLIKHLLKKKFKIMFPDATR